MPDNNLITNLDLSKPFFLVKMERTKGAHPGKYFWSPNMFMDNEGPEVYSIQENSFITGIRVTSNFSPPINECKLRFNNIAGHSPDLSTGDRIEVFFGYYKKNNPSAAEYAKVFTGYVTEIDRGMTQCRVSVISRLSSLFSLRRHMVINRDTIDKVIEKLTAEAEDIEVNEISKSDIQKSRFIITESENLYENISELCLQGGMDLYMDVHDKLLAKLWEPDPASPDELGLESVYPLTLDDTSTVQKIHNFHIGLEIIDIEIRHKSAAINSLEIRSFSSYGEENERQFSIEPTGVKKNIEDDGRDFQPRQHKVMYLPYTPRDSAEQIASNLLRYYNSCMEGRLTVIGSPHVRLNDGVRVIGKIFGKRPFGDVTASESKWNASYENDMPEDDKGDGKIFHVVGVEHVFDLERGFVSTFDLEEREPPVVETMAVVGPVGEVGEAGMEPTMAAGPPEAAIGPGSDTAGIVDIDGGAAAGETRMPDGNDVMDDEAAGILAQDLEDGEIDEPGVEMDESVAGILAAEGMDSKIAVPGMKIDESLPSIPAVGDIDSTIGVPGMEMDEVVAGIPAVGDIDSPIDMPGMKIDESMAGIPVAEGMDGTIGVPGADIDESMAGIPAVGDIDSPLAVPGTEMDEVVAGIPKVDGPDAGVDLPEPGGTQIAESIPPADEDRVVGIPVAEEDISESEITQDKPGTKAKKSEKNSD